MERNINSKSLPRIATRDEWKKARKEFLAKEKEFTRARDALNAERRRLPMVELDKDYILNGKDGKAKLINLFEGRRQLIVYHFMFDPNWEKGCVGCSMIVDSIGHLSHLHARDTSLVLVSHAPFSKIEPFKNQMGWKVPWFSSFNSDFNSDFEAISDGVQHHGVSVFLRDGDRIFHTYSTYLRGVDILFSPFNYLDLTPLGRQETWEDSPEGYPQSPPYEWWRHHDNYADFQDNNTSCHSGKNYE